MDFFTDLGNKITNTGKSVADKAKDLTELTKLNAKVVSEENKLSKAYGEIGRLYYAQTQGELGEGYEEQAAAAKAALSEIAALKERIKALKGVRVCVQCGKEIGKNDLYCCSCGAKNELEEPETKTMDQICPVCKSVVPVDVVYCPTCGEKLIKEEEAAAESGGEEGGDACGCGCGESENSCDCSCEESEAACGCKENEAADDSSEENN